MNQIGDDGRSTGTTSLYLVRVWTRRSRDGALSLHGKLQHAVSGASCNFDGLSGLPEALAMMMDQEAGSFGPDEASPVAGGPDEAGA